MNEGNPVDIKALTELAKTTKEVFPKTVDETDSALSTLIGWFDDFILYPMKKARITYRYKLECFEEDLRKKVEKIPPEELQMPKLMIAGPTLEALKYSYDEQTLREMFVNLLATSMDRRQNASIHPAFVEIIKQLSPLDARFINIFRNRNSYPGITVYKKTHDIVTPYLQDVIELYEFSNSFEKFEQIHLTMVLDNLIRLGLIVKDSELLDAIYDYSSLEKHWQYQEYERVKGINSTLIYKKFQIDLTELGRAFKRCCLEK